MGARDRPDELPISPYCHTVKQGINANDDAGEEIELSGEEDEDETAEARKVKVQRDPRQPTREEIEAHNITHVPYRDWCPRCIMGSDPNRPHTKQGNAGYAIPHLVCDYCFLGDKDQG